ncbi:MAG: 3-dehydroquinate synthase family protein [Elusimicrobiota bacterium]|jgi:3-dehydroquinate synthetase
MKAMSWRVGGRRTRTLVGRGLLGRPGLLARMLPGADRVAVVTDARCRRLFLPRLLRSLGRAPDLVHLLPRGERAKCGAELERLHRALLAGGFSRDSALVALGGGAVSDLCGFAAATFMRGVRWACAPTTLLAQIDAGLGGKTGVDLAGVKNAVGAFHQPEAVLCDPELLESLGPRELRAGHGELLKYALLFERRFPATSAVRPPRGAALERAVERCVRWKMSVVAQDERETRSRREVLNLGHTFGHGFEAAARGALRHGEAVLLGLRAAVRLSELEGLLPAPEARRLRGLLAALPCPRPRLRAAEVLRHMGADKKRRGGRLRFVLLRGPGRPVVAGARAANVARVLKEIL